jgi:hypothetical protein
LLIEHKLLTRIRTYDWVDHEDEDFIREVMVYLVFK